MIFSVIEYGSVPEISGTELFYAQKKTASQRNGRIF